mmetsp:Transcript_18608/g.30228  ORF Transcript_18608/g.30228 Transcript_18608/m.30228 type:complete len:201 (-) Transcript_18608:33-635(-)
MDILYSSYVFVVLLLLVLLLIVVIFELLPECIFVSVAAVIVPTIAFPIISIFIADGACSSCCSKLGRGFQQTLLGGRRLTSKELDQLLIRIARGEQLGIIAFFFRLLHYGLLFLGGLHGALVYRKPCTILRCELRNGFKAGTIFIRMFPHIYRSGVECLNGDGGYSVGVGREGLGRIGYTREKLLALCLPSLAKCLVALS